MHAPELSNLEFDQIQRHSVITQYDVIDDIMSGWLLAIAELT